MMNRGVAISYGDVAPEAKENFIPITDDTKYNTLDQLQVYNLNFPNYANPCELYSVVLDGTATAFPSNAEDSNIGLISDKLSGANGVFETPIELELESEGQYSSQGLTFTFDTFNQIYPTRILIKWLRITDDGVTVLSEKEFSPSSAFYFCQNAVENYNKVVITFHSLNMPYNRLKLRVIDYGYGTMFYGDELRNTKLIQEIDPISSQLSINTADFTIDSKRDIEYSFQAKQPLSIYFNGDLKATTFVKTSKRKARFLWDIQSEDYIGLMDSIPYYGGMYENANAVEVLEDIFTVAKIPYEISNEFEGVTISGYIPYTTCREALMQIAFAIQAVVDTSDNSVVSVFALEKDIKQTIPLKRIMQGQNFADEDTVTGVEVTSHIYKKQGGTDEIYNAEQSGVGENIFIKFSEPYHYFEITNGSIIKSHPNYVIINALEGCVLNGRKYEHITQVLRKDNPVVLASEIEKVVAVANATLVSPDNAEAILESCYAWLTRTNTTNLKIVEGKHIEYGVPIKYGQRKYGTFKYGETTPNVVTYDKPVKIGDMIEAETEYLGNVKGCIIKQTFSLNGNILVKEAVLK